MQALKALVIGMGVLIVAGVVVIAVTIVHRLSPQPSPPSPPPSAPLSSQSGPMASAILDEPAGTRIVASSVTADRLALTLQGAGPDRVVVLDLRTGQVVGRVGLAR